MAKRVYLFNEGNKDDRELLGGKGANLCEMTAMGLPVPFGFVITTATCREYFQTGNKMPSLLEQEYRVALDMVEKKMGARFGDPENPLLFSVRSGAPVSMPGMMNTILNLGLNDDIAAGLAAKTNNPGLPTIATVALFPCLPMWSWVSLARNLNQRLRSTRLSREKRSTWK